MNIIGSSGLMFRTLSFWRRVISIIVTRTKATEVNIEMIRPSAMVTAKPRTGPVPNQNRIAAAISAVMLPSIIVE